MLIMWIVIFCRCLCCNFCVVLWWKIWIWWINSGKSYEWKQFILPFYIRRSRGLCHDMRVQRGDSIMISVGERTEKLEKCQIQFESRLKLLERQKNPSSGSGGGVDLIEPLLQMKVTDSNKNANQPTRVGVRPIRPATPWYFIQGGKLSSVKEIQFNFP